MAYILVVDDDLDILKIASHVLSAGGHFVFTASNAQEAMDHVANKKFDLIITDANMPVHSGYDLLHTLKQNPDYKDVPVAFLTGRREKKDIQRAVSLGAVDYIIKPIDPFLLNQKINQILNQFEQNVTSLEIAKTKVSSAAFIQLPTVILNLSEIGMELESQEKIQISRKIKLDSNIFQNIGIEQPFMKVLSCIEDKDKNCFNIKVQFLGMNDQDLQKIRAWMLQASAKLSA